MIKPWIAGVDEAGRGPLAGPVVAAAVVLDPDVPIEGLDDSKKLGLRQRERLYTMIQKHAVATCIEQASVQEIEDLNILNASLLAMKRAVLGLDLWPGLVRVDGHRAPDLGTIEVQTIVGGDALDASISAASILAKVARDRIMIELDQRYPGYGLAQHKGYPTAQHRAALKALGPSPIHRASFRGVLQVEE
ncbi:MAG: ribonuclease HII [Pseudomonadota bacterium]